jgi:Flp pilus assembly protein TadB
MHQRTTRSRYIEMGFGRRGGFWAGVVAVLSGIVVIVLAVLFSALFLGLFVAIAIGVMVRSWLLGRGSRRSQPEVIEAEYRVIDQGDPQRRRSGS